MGKGSGHLGVLGEHADVGAVVDVDSPVSNPSAMQGVGLCGVDLNHGSTWPLGCFYHAELARGVGRVHSE